MLIAMADKRKLQGDIERCLKKVTEGVDLFEEIWQKIHSAANSNQKEKYEADLKKEIKKLQRLRDQIKTWLTSNDIKDKSVLQENRKLIETQMERFKIIERETKIKAYSKEGLGAVQKVDPAQKEKDKITSWLTDSIDSLSIQVDHYESEIETLHAVTKKKKNQKEKLNRIEELETWLSKHRYHIYQLEAILRMLDNGTVEVHQIKKIQDDVKHYVDSSQESDFQENEYIYDDIGLEDFEEFLAKQRTVCNAEGEAKVTPDEESSTTGLPSSNTSTSASSSSPLCNAVSSIQMKEPENKSLKMSAATANPGMNSVGIASSSVSSKQIPSSKSSNVSTESSSSSMVSDVTSTVPDSSVLELPFTPSSPGKYNNALHISRMIENCRLVGNEECEKVNGNHSSSSSENASSLTSSTCGSHSTHPCPVQYCNSTANQNSHVPDSEHHHAESRHCHPVETPNVSTRSEQAHAIIEPRNIPIRTEANITPSNIDIDFPELPSSTVPVNSEVRSTKVNDGNIPLWNIFHRPSVSNGRLESQFQTSQHSVPVDDGGRLLPGKGPPRTITTPFFGIKIEGFVGPPLIGSYPMDSPKVLQESRSNLHILDSVSQRLKYLPDCNRVVRTPLNNYPCNVPHYYKTHLPNCDTFDFFQRLSTETLFFIFYYMEGSKAQYLAAKTLKKHSWRFHTRLMLWFQRHEEPKRITEEYEQGTYIYFDYEKWSQRKKDGFTFEYRYLEDIDLK